MNRMWRPRPGIRCAATPGAQAGAPGRAHVDAGGWEAQLAGHLARGVVRRHDHGVGARRVRARQPREVAAHLGLGLLRMPEEVEIVDGHHLRGAWRMG